MVVLAIRIPSQEIRNEPVRQQMAEDTGLSSGGHFGLNFEQTGLQRVATVDTVLDSKYYLAMDETQGVRQGMAFVPYQATTKLASLAAISPSCSEIPKEMTSVTNRSYILEQQQAIDLNITFSGSTSVAVKRSQKIFVREISRFALCDAKDDSAVLHYGAVWRATVSIDDEDASANINFAVVAASATLRNSSVRVEIENRGFSDSGVNAAGQAAMKTVEGGLNVQSFSKFSDAIETTIGSVLASPVEKPLLIGVSPKHGSNLVIAVATVFALSCYSDHKSLDDAIRELPADTPSETEAIKRTYAELDRTGGVGVNTELRRQIANNLLHARRLKKRLLFM